MNATTDYGYVKEDKVYLKGFEGLPDRQIGEVKDTPEAALQYFVDRFSVVTGKVQQLVDSIDEAQNKGSYLMKLLHLREQLYQFDALGDFPALLQRLTEKEQEIRTLIRQNREKNLEIKRALVAEVLPFEGSVNWKEDADKLKELKLKWLKTGSVDEEHRADTEERFFGIVNDFFERRRQFYEARREMTERRVVRYQELTRQAEALRWQQRTPEQVREGLNEIMEQWREVGPIPKPKQAELWKRFKQVRTQLLRRPTAPPPRRHTNPRALSPAELAANLAEKEALCREADALATLDQRAALDSAKELQRRWKGIGPVEREDHIRLSKRFSAACNRVFEMDYLLRVSYARNRDYQKLSPKEQLRHQINVLQELIRRDRTELQTYEENYQNLTVSKDQSVNRLFQSKLNAQRRKLEAKQNLLAELSAQANNA